MRCRPSWSLSTWGSKHACDKNRRSSVTYASISSVFPPHPTPFSRTTKYIVCCVKKNQSTPRPSEHPPVMGEKMSKCLGRIKGCKYCCCLHIKSRSDLYSVPVPSNIRTGPTDANAFRGHRLTTQKEYTYAAHKTKNIFLKKHLDRKRRFEIFRLCT